MSKSKQRDIQELTYILKNQKKITEAIKRMNVSLDSAGSIQRITKGCFGSHQGM